MKKFLLGTLTAVMMFGFGSFAQASDLDTVNLSCRGNCHYNEGCDYDGEYCNRHGHYRYNSDGDDKRGEYCDRYGCKKQ